MLGPMANVVVLLVVVLLAGAAMSFVLRRRHSFVPRRGTSVGADLGALSDQPRVQVQAVTVTGPGRVRLVLAPEAAADSRPEITATADLDFIVSLDEAGRELELLQGWQRSSTALAMVVPPGSRLLRLRSIDELQPLTLHRLDQG